LAASVGEALPLRRTTIGKGEPICPACKRTTRQTKEEVVNAAAKNSAAVGTTGNRWATF